MSLIRAFAIFIALIVATTASVMLIYLLWWAIKDVVADIKAAHGWDKEDK